jgi:hypothetical protein
MSRINKKQLAAMALITDIFAVFCLRGRLTVLTAAAFVLVILLQTALLPLIERLYAAGGKPAKALLLLWMIFWGGVLFTMQWRTSEVIYIPGESSGGIWGKLMVSGLIGLVCIYISSAGIRAMARASVIAAAVGAVCLLVVTLSAVSGADWENLTVSTGHGSFSGELLRGLCISGGLGSYIALSSISGKKSFRSGTAYLAVRGAITAVLLLVSVLIAGGIMEIAEYPVVMAAQLAQPFPSQRIDSLFLIVFAVYAVFAIGVQSAAADMLLEELFPRFHRFRSLCAVAAMVGAAFAIARFI